VGDSGDDSSKEATGFGIFEIAKSKRVENRDRSRTHREDVAEDAAYACGCALEGFDGGGVVVGFDFEGELESVAQIDNSSVFTWPDEDAIACSWKLFEQGAGVFVAAVFRPHHPKHT